MTRILVVEDEPAIALGLEDDLKMEGYEVEVVRDGGAAARRGRDGGFDLILLDVMLPGKDGFEVCRELRRAGLRTPIIMLTAKAHEEQKVMGLELGADDYVTKPFGTRELRARIRARGRVLNRQQLLDAAWGHGASPPRASSITTSPTCATRSSPIRPARAISAMCAASVTASKLKRDTNMTLCRLDFRTRRLQS